MIEIPAWIIYTLISAPFIGGIGIGVWSSKFVRRNELRDKMGDCRKAINEQQNVIIDKIDQIYEWMVTGVIVIRRNDK